MLFVFECQRELTRIAHNTRLTQGSVQFLKTNPFVTGANKAEADAGDSADFSFNQG